MGTVFRRKGRSRWYYKVRLASGRWSAPRAGFSDKRATERRAEQEQALIDRGEVGLVDRHARHRHAPIAGHVDAFAAALEGRHRSPKHVRMTRRRLSALLAAMQATTLAAVDLGGAEMALGQLMARGMSPRTRDHYAAALKEFGAWLVDADRLGRNPIEKLHPVATDADVRRERLALTAAQVLQLVAAAAVRPVQQYRRHHPEAAPVTLEVLERQGRRRGLLYLAAALTGLRRSELAGLRWADLRLGERPTMLPRAATTKAKRREHLPLDAELARRLSDYRRELAAESGRVPAPTDAVFHVAKNLTEQLRKDAEWAEIPVVDDLGRRLDLQALRATAATLMATSGVPMQSAKRLIRHTDARLTAKHYEKVAVEDLRPGVAQLGAAFWTAVAPQVEPNSAAHDGAARRQSAPESRALDLLRRMVHCVDARYWEEAMAIIADADAAEGRR